MMNKTSVDCSLKEFYTQPMEKDDKFIYHFMDNAVNFRDNTCKNTDEVRFSYFQSSNND
jgi:hypothetical protein